MQVSPLRDTTVISTPLEPHVTRCTLTARSGAFDRMRSSTIALACIACMPHYDQSCLADLDLHTCAAVGNTKEREAGRERGGARSKPAGEGAGIGNRLQEERERGDVKDAVGTTGEHLHIANSSSFRHGNMLKAFPLSRLYQHCGSTSASLL